MNPYSSKECCPSDIMTEVVLVWVQRPDFKENDSKDKSKPAVRACSYESHNIILHTAKDLCTDHPEPCMAAVDGERYDDNF